MPGWHAFFGRKALLQNPAIKFITDKGLNFEQGAHSAAVATGRIVKECAKSIDVEVAFDIAVCQPPGRIAD
jgi:hypothetical protein